MSEWIQGNRITVYNRPIEVWMKNGQVRRIILNPENASDPWFTDCTHPLQNVVCAREYIEAWRLVDGASIAEDQAINQAAGLSAYERVRMGLPSSFGNPTSNPQT